MINPLTLLKELRAAVVTRDSLSKVDWKHGLIPGLVSLVTTLGALYAAFGGLLPPQYAFAAAVAISGLYLVLEAILRSQHQTMPAVPGIPADSLDKLIALIETKYPQLAKVEPVVREVVSGLTEKGSSSQVTLSPMV